MAKFQFMREMLYSFKREYGRVLDIYRLSNQVMNTTTGRMTFVRSKIRVRQAVILPVDLKLKFFVAMYGKNFGYDSEGLTKDLTQVIIDRKDMPSTYEVEKDDYCIFEGERYLITKMETLPERLGYMLWLDATKGQTFSQVQDLRAENYLELTHNVKINN